MNHLHPAVLLLPLFLLPTAAAQEDSDQDLAAAQATRVEAGTLKILGQPVRSHDGMLTSVELRPDGRACVSAGWDGTVRVWNLAADDAPLVLPVDGIAYFAGWCGDRHRHVVASSTDGSLQVWNSRTGERVAALTPEVEPRKGSVSPDGRLLALAGEESDAVTLYDVSEGLVEVGSLDCAGATKSCFAWAPDGKHLAIGGILPARVWIFDVAAREAVASLDPETMPTAMTVRADGAALAIGGYDSLDFWTFPAPGDEPYDALSGFETTVLGLHFANDEQVVFGDSEGSLLRLQFAGDSPEILWQVDEHRGAIVSTSRHQDLIVSASRDTTLRFWDIADGSEQLRRAGSRDMVQAVTFSADGASVLAGDYGNAIAVYDAASGALRSAAVPHENSVETVGSVADTLVSIASDDTFVRIDPASGAVRATGMLAGDELPYLMCGSVHDGRLLGGWEDGRVRFHDLTDGSLVGSFAAADEVPVAELAVSEDGQRLAVLDWNGRIRLLDAAGTEIADLHDVGDEGSAVMAFVGSDAVVVASSDGMLRIFAAADGAKRSESMLVGEDDSVQVMTASSAQGGRIAVGSISALTVLDASGKVLGSTPDFVAIPSSIAFSPDGKKLATGMSDATTLLWDVASLMN